MVSEFSYLKTEPKLLFLNGCGYKNSCVNNIFKVNVCDFFLLLSSYDKARSQYRS